MFITLLIVADGMRLSNSTVAIPFFVDEELNTMCFMINVDSKYVSISGMETISAFPSALKVHESLDDSLLFLLHSKERFAIIHNSFFHVLSPETRKSFFCPGVGA